MDIHTNAAEWSTALVELAMDWNRETVDVLFDVIDAVNWSGDSTPSYDKEEKRLDILLTDTDDFMTMLIQIFEDESVAVYVENDSEKIASITAEISDLPMIMKMYRLIVLHQSDDVDVEFEDQYFIQIK